MNTVVESLGLDPLISRIPQDEVRRVLEKAEGDIDPSFLGFTSTYIHLAEIIPTSWTVIDFGCGYNPQAYLFLNHKRYVAIDYPLFSNTERFHPEGTELYIMDGADWLRQQNTLTRQTFAICNYVPDTELQQLIKNTFTSVFVFYP